MTNSAASGQEGAFIATKEHRRFVEFATAVRKHRYIGLCYGPAGVGKTLSARRYAHWDLAEPLIEGWGDVCEAVDAGVQAALSHSRTVFHTASVLGTLRDLRDDMTNNLVFVSRCIEEQLRGEGVEVRRRDVHRLVEMVIVDETERMSTTAIELIRDIFDRTGIGVILIGMPGMEKRLGRVAGVVEIGGAGPARHGGRGQAARSRPVGERSRVGQPSTRRMVI